MLHTAKFKIQLNEKEVRALKFLYGEHLTLIGSKIRQANTQPGITCTVYWKFKKWWVTLNVNFVEMLERGNITEKDLPLVNSRIATFLDTYFPNINHNLNLIKIEYRFDSVPIPNHERELYFKLIKKLEIKKNYKKQNTTFKSTFYLANKSIQCCIYDKSIERAAVSIVSASLKWQNCDGFACL